jgi:hypothetical protein
MEKADIEMKLTAMPFEEKIKLLGEEDKAYISGYIEKAVLDYQKLKNAKKHREKEAEREGISDAFKGILGSEIQTGRR